MLGFWLTAGVRFQKIDKDIFHRRCVTTWKLSHICTNRINGKRFHKKSRKKGLLSRKTNAKRVCQIEREKSDEMRYGKLLNSFRVFAQEAYRWNPSSPQLLSMAVQIERIQKDIGIINIFNATPEKGITRLTFSEEYQGAIAYVVDELKQVGAKISYCQAGNIKARLPGTNDNGPAVMIPLFCRLDKDRDDLRAKRKGA